MTKLFFALFTLLSAFVATAQTKNNTDFTIWQVQPDSNLVVFANKCYLRSAPSLKASIIDSLAHGQIILVKEITKDYAEVKGIYASWIKVQSNVNGKTVEGYAWLGLMAIKAMNDGNQQYFYGLERIEKDKEDFDTYVIGLKVRNADSLLSSTQFKTSGGESGSFTTALLLGNTKLKNLENVIRISFGGEACGIPTTYYYYGFTGQKLLPLPGKYSVGDAGVFYHDETLLFPHEKGGQPGKIIKLIEEEEVLEEATETKKEKVKRKKDKEVYAWDGLKATRQKM